MAKLSAHGTEVARIVYGLLDVGGTRVETTISYRSDGYALRKTTFRPANRPVHSAGWTVRGRIKDPKRDTQNRLIKVAQLEARRAGDRLISTTHP